LKRTILWMTSVEARDAVDDGRWSARSLDMPSARGALALNPEFHFVQIEVPCPWLAFQK
jgi:hypothetical protein